ncbi:hypothetical protein TEK04_20835 [Klenkia sp. LSe6-5]|uniref:Uncharacterized protein n=1 Tax=Klenkia sesuvii TaxID=3103137 RepID=A0ABU8DZS0_9ACTN
MTADPAFWTPVVDRVLRDVAATTDLGTTWRFQHRTTEPDVLRTPGLTLWFGDDGPGEWVVPDPVLELRLPRTRFELPDLRDVDEALLFLADRVQDHLVDELHGAWPLCPGHTHPMRPAPSGTGPAWRCPAGTGADVEVGALR